MKEVRDLEYAINELEDWIIYLEKIIDEYEYKTK